MVNDRKHAIKTVLDHIREPDAFGGNPPHWDTAMAAMPVGRPAFLDPDAIPARRAAAGLPSARDTLLCDMAATVAADPALTRFAWYLHWRVFIALEHGLAWGPPSLMNRLGPKAGLFYELLALEFPSRLAAWHKRLGYPDAVTGDTIRQISSFEQNHLRGRDCPGLYENQFPWLATYLTNAYVRLGRFEYMLADHYGVNVWRHRCNGDVVALANDGTRVADDGLCLPPGASDDAGWTAHLTEAPDRIHGFPIAPNGRITRHEATLKTAEWAPCLRKGMTVLDMHIPAGGGMGWEAVAESFGRALAFFPHYHPDRPFAALVCRTWFLDPQLERVLPADSHILRLQRAVHLVPVAATDSLWFVFLCDANNEDPARLPRDTDLRRRLADFLLAGGILHGGSMFLLPEGMALIASG